MRGWCATSGDGGVELAFPALSAHLVVRLGDEPVSVAGVAERRFTSRGHAVVLVGRQTPWLRRRAAGQVSVGLELAPWEVEPLLGVPAQALAGAHLSLVDVVPGASSLRAQLLEVAPAHRAAALAAWARSRCARGPQVHAVVPWAFAALARGQAVSALVTKSGLSHRRFIEVFHRWTGLRPREVGQLGRLVTAAQLLAQGRLALADVAHEAGFADQPHLTRTLVATAGLTPARLRQRAPFQPGHLKLEARKTPLPAKRGEVG